MTQAEITIATLKSLLDPLKRPDLVKAWVKLRGCHTDQPEVREWLNKYLEERT
jgi:hypothetical protein